MFSIPVDGNWGPWNPEDIKDAECNRTCGGGFQHRYRKCDDPVPKGGRSCPGIGVHVVFGCNSVPCPSMLFVLLITHFLQVLYFTSL